MKVCVVPLHLSVSRSLRTVHGLMAERFDACWTHSVGIGQNRQAAAMHTHSIAAPVVDHEPRNPKRPVSQALALSSKWWRIRRMSLRGR